MRAESSMRQVGWYPAAAVIGLVLAVVLAIGSILGNDGGGSAPDTPSYITITDCARLKAISDESIATARIATDPARVEALIERSDAAEARWRELRCYR